MLLFFPSHSSVCHDWHSSRQWQQEPTDQPTNQPCQVDWGYRIHRLHLCRGVRPSPSEHPWYDTKQSDNEVTVMLEFWGMRSTPSFPSLPGPIWPGLVTPDRVLSMSQKQLPCVLMQNWIVWDRTVLYLNSVLFLYWIVWNVTVFDI